MKKLLTTLLALSLLLSVTPTLFAETPSNAGSPTFDVHTELGVMTTIAPTAALLYEGESLELTATTTYTSNKHENQLLHFVSDAWMGVDGGNPAQEVELEADPAAGDNERQKAFIATATIAPPEEPGEYELVVTYTITLQHDSSGKRVYTSTASATIPITVMEGPRPEDSAIDQPEVKQGEPLNHGQIVSAWAHWKQSKGNKNFRKGGPGVYRSLVWYKTQVEHGTFYSQQEVWDYLDSIYEPTPDHRGNPGKGNPGKGNPKKGN